MNHFRAAERLPHIKSQDEIDDEDRWVTPEQMVAITSTLGMAILLAAMWCVGVFFVIGIYAAMFLAVQAILYAPDAWKWVRGKLGWA